MYDYYKLPHRECIQCGSEDVEWSYYGYNYCPDCTKEALAEEFGLDETGDPLDPKEAA